MINHIDITELEKNIQHLWQGKNIDLSELVEWINDRVQDIMDNTPKMQELGIVFPMEYVTAAMKNLSASITELDDYLLTDNLYYEWREIFMVYNEIAMEIQKKNE